MNTINNLRTLFLIFILVFAAYACSDLLGPNMEEIDKAVLEETIATTNQGIMDSIQQVQDSTTYANLQVSIFQFDSIINTFENPSMVEVVDPPQITAGPTTTTNNGIICEETSYQWALGQEEAFLYDPTSDVIYITAPMIGSSIQDGSYQPIVGDVSPKIISISLENVGGSPSIEVKQPTLSNVRNAIAELLRQLAPSSTPARLSKTIEQVYSESQVNVAVRGNFKGFGAKVNASFDWSDSSVKSRLLFNFLQVYYTIDMDIRHAKVSEYFDDENLPNIEQFGEEYPVYVSSVKYGRQVVFSIESSHSESEVRAALEASYNSVLASGGISISAQQRQVLQQSKISAFIVGGSGLAATGAVGSIGALEAFMVSGGEYSSESPGAPLAYTMRYMHDNTIARVALSSEYTVRECTDVGLSYSFTPMDGDMVLICPYSVSGDNQFYGNGPEVTGRIELYYEESAHEIWAKFDFTFRETNNDSVAKTNGGDDDADYEERRVATLPEHLTFRGFETDPVAHVHYVDTTDDQPDGMDEINVDGQFIHNIIINGNTDGDDLPCRGYDDSASYVALWFDSITLNMGEE